MPKAIDLTGKTFGRLTVLRLERDGDGLRRWLCLCTCGRHSTPSTGSLNFGNATSCGTCRRIEAMKKNRPLTTRPEQAWQPAELAMLGQHLDKEVARRIGRSAQAVMQKRRALGILPHTRRRFRWTAAALAVLGTAADQEIAGRLGCDPQQVRRKRYALGIEAHGGLEDRRCEICRRDFVGTCRQVHCSAVCLEEARRSGKYSSAHAQRRVATEMAVLAEELERRLAEGSHA